MVKRFEGELPNGDSAFIEVSDSIADYVAIDVAANRNLTPSEASEEVLGFDVFGDDIFSGVGSEDDDESDDDG